MTSSTKELGFDDQGNHKVTITAEDSAGNIAELEIIVSIEDVNRPASFGAGSFEYITLFILLFLEILDYQYICSH